MIAKQTINHSFLRDDAAVSTKVGPVHLLAIIGFSCYIIWELFGIFASLPFLHPQFNDEHLYLFRPVGFGVLALSFFATMKVAPFLHHHMRVFFGIGVLGSAITLILTGTSLLLQNLSTVTNIIAWCFYALSLTGFMVCWALYFCTRFDESTHLIITLGYAIGFTLFFVCSLLMNSESSLLFLLVGIIVVATTAGLVAFLFTATSSSIGQSEKEAPSKHSSPSSWHRQTKASFARFLHATTYGITYGFAITLLQTLGPLASSIGACSGVLGCVIGFFAFKLNRLGRGNDIRRLTFIPVVVALLFFAVNPPLSYVICSIPIIAASIFTAITSWANAAKQTYELRYQPIGAFCASKLPGWLGFFLGTILSASVVTASTSGFAIIVAALTGLSCVSFAIFELRAYDDPLDKVTENEISPENPIELIPESHFRARCDTLAKDFALSPREKEVFYLLAKGRNAEFISNELCIARPTTKTHIQHIYQKLGVNSHQQLINLVDNRHSEKQ